jgi:predicted flap endonuclease-1-like 5' DNA nuclease
MTALDPAAKEKAHEPTPEPAKKKGDELTAKELKGLGPHYSKSFRYHYYPFALSAINMDCKT